MERVELIIKKLQQLINDNASVDVLLTISQMLVVQLEELQTVSKKSVSIILPRHPELITDVSEKEIEVLTTQVNVENIITESITESISEPINQSISDLVLNEPIKAVEENHVLFIPDVPKHQDLIFDYEPSVENELFILKEIHQEEKADAIEYVPENNLDEIFSQPVFVKKDRFSFFTEPLRNETEEKLVDVVLEEPHQEYVLDIPDEMAIQMGVQPKPPMSVSPNDFIFEEYTRIPTLDLNEIKPVAREVRTTNNEEEEINNKFKEHKVEVAHLLENTHIKDLKKAMSINERYLFINDLFKGDEHLFERSVKHIQSFSILPEATFWIERELKIPLQWSSKDEVVQLFDQLVKRRFN